MGIFKESLPIFVKKQIRVREGIMQLGNNPTQNRGQTKAKSFQHLLAYLFLAYLY